MSSSSSNQRNCGCGQPAGMWTAWTIRNPGRRFLGCKNYRDENNHCGYFRWFDPQLPNRWYREKMYELRGQANGEAIMVDGPLMHRSIFMFMRHPLKLFFKLLKIPMVTLLLNLVIMKPVFGRW
ncbi:hypothetical protein LXL04_016774 [Taraxacum kok-saghyz]